MEQNSRRGGAKPSSTWLAQRFRFRRLGQEPDARDSTRSALPAGEAAAEDGLGGLEGGDGEEPDRGYFSGVSVGHADHELDQQPGHLAWLGRRGDSIRSVRFWSSTSPTVPRSFARSATGAS
jgi:hypothetical protein